MIVFDLACAEGHRFEGWFASSGAFAEQHARGLVECPHCGSAAVEKAPMAPAVPAKSNARTETAARKHPVTGQLPPEVARALQSLAAAQAKGVNLVDLRAVPDERVRMDTETVTEQATVTEGVRKEQIEVDGDQARDRKI